MTVRPLRRWALLLVASAIAVGPIAVAPPADADTPFACADGAACVHITFPGSGRPAVDVPASVLDPAGGNDDINQETYELRYRAGDSPDIVTGVSLHKLLTSVVPQADQLNTTAVTYAELSSPGSSYESTLRVDELNDPSPFLLQQEPVFAVSGDDTDIEYVRPQRNAEDLNGPDRFLTGTLTRTIDLAVYTSGAVVHPTITVSGTRHINSPLTFTASFAADDPPHAGATFAWTFAAGDPSEAGGQTTTHTYHANDTYQVSVAVSGNDPDVGAFSGQSPSVTVQIGSKPPPGKGPPGGNGKGGKKHPSSGPTKAPGHHQGSSPTGGPTAAPTSAAPTDTAGSAGPSGPTATPTSNAPTPGTSDSSPATSTPDPGSAAGAFVQGVLITQPTAPTGGTPPSEATRAAASARRPGRLSASFDARWLWLLVPVALLGAGAFGERRRGAHRHGPQSRL